MAQATAQSNVYNRHACIHSSCKSGPQTIQSSLNTLSCRVSCFYHVSTQGHKLTFVSACCTVTPWNKMLMQFAQLGTPFFRWCFNKKRLQGGWRAPLTSVMFHCCGLHVVACGLKLFRKYQSDCLGIRCRRMGRLSLVFSMQHMALATLWRFP